MHRTDNKGGIFSTHLNIWVGSLYHSNACVRINLQRTHFLVLSFAHLSLSFAILLVMHWFIQSAGIFLSSMCQAQGEVLRVSDRSFSQYSFYSVGQGRQSKSKQLKIVSKSHSAKEKQDRSQTQREKHCMISLICRIYKSQIHKSRE